MNKHHLAKHNEAMTSDRGLRIWMKIALCNFRKKFLTFFSIRIFPVLLLQCCMPAGLDGWNSHVCMSHLLFLIYSYAQALDLDTQWAKIRKKVRYEKCQNKICIDNIRSDIRLVNRVQLSSHLAWIFTIHGTTSTCLGRLYSGIWCRHQSVFARPIILYRFFKTWNSLHEVTISSNDVEKKFKQNLEFLSILKILMIIHFFVNREKCFQTCFVTLRGRPACTGRSGHQSPPTATAPPRRQHQQKISAASLSCCWIF